MGYKDLCEHIFSVKTMGADHKKAAEKMSNIKKKVRLRHLVLEILDQIEIVLDDHIIDVFFTLFVNSKTSK